MNKGIKEEVDKISLNLLLARNIENSYLNNCIDIQKLYNQYTIPNNSLYGNLSGLQTINNGFNPNLIMSNIHNLGNLNSLLSYQNLNNNVNMANYNNYANYNNSINKNENPNYYSSKSSISECKKVHEEKVSHMNGLQTVRKFYQINSLTFYFNIRNLIIKLIL